MRNYYISSVISIVGYVSFFRKMFRAGPIIKNGFKKVSHVIFDLDGLLLDSEMIYTQATRNVVERYGKEYTTDLIRQILGLPGLELAEHIVKSLDLPVTSQEFFDLKFLEQQKLKISECNLKPGAERFVRHLHKHRVPIAVATSSSRESFDNKIQKHQEFFSLFNHLVTGGSDPEVKKGKPSPDIFLICASRFPDKPEPAKCLVLEDAPNGVTAAVGAGMQCVMIPDPEIVSPDFQKGATLVLNSLEEFKPELFGLPPY